ncbi:MAG: hypothetical protein HYV97_08000 [Bdellovibrio sp.]|nr:hypothetical protein [Bdellovibrio sp.]
MNMNLRPTKLSFLAFFLLSLSCTPHDPQDVGDAKLYDDMKSTLTEEVVLYADDIRNKMFDLFRAKKGSPSFSLDVGGILWPKGSADYGALDFIASGSDYAVKLSGTAELYRHGHSPSALTWENYTITTDFKINKGKAYFGFYQFSEHISESPQKGYWLEYTGANWKLYRQDKKAEESIANRTTLAVNGQSLPLGVWKQLKIVTKREFSGVRIKALIDNTLLFDHLDTNGKSFFGDVRFGVHQGELYLDNLKITSKVDFSQTWKQAQLYGGMVRTVTAHPSKENVAYMGGADGGVYHTEDYGNTWQEIGIPNGLSKIRIRSIKVAPNNHNVLYVGTAAKHISSYWRSEDSGKTWQWTAAGEINRGGEGWALAVDPSNWKHVFFSVTGDGVFESFDGGESMTPISKGKLHRNDGSLVKRTVYNETSKSFSTIYTGGGLMRDIAIDDTKTINGYRQIMAASMDFADWNANGKIAFPIIRSIDGGQSWQEFSENLYTGYLKDDMYIESPVEIKEIVFRKGNPTLGPVQVFAVTDVFAAETANSEVEIADTSSEEFILEESHLLDSQDLTVLEQGSTFEETDPFLVLGDQNLTAFNLPQWNSEDLVIALSLKGILYVLPNDGKSKKWVQLNGTGGLIPNLFQGTTPMNVRIDHSTKPSRVVVIAQKAVWEGDGIYNWRKVGDGHNLLNGDLSKANPSYIYGSSLALGMQVSNDAGASFQSKNLGNKVSSVRAVTISGYDSNLAFAAAEGGIYRSDNAGITWKSLGEYGRYNALAMPSNTNQVIYAGGGMNNTTILKKSTDGGQTWSSILKNQFWSSINTIAVDPKASNRVFVGAGEGPQNACWWRAPDNIYKAAKQIIDGNDISNPNYELAKAIIAGKMSTHERCWGTGLWLSEDAGASWTWIASVPLRAVSTINIHPANSNLVVISTLGNGVYISTDGGRNFNSANGPCTFKADGTPDCIWPNEEQDEKGNWNAYGRIVQAMAVDPTSGFNQSDKTINLDKLVIYAGTAAHYANSKDAKGNALWKSINGGKVWTRLLDGNNSPVKDQSMAYSHDVAYRNIGFGGGVDSMVIDPNFPERVFFGLHDPGVLVTHDGGKNFRWAQEGYLPIMSHSYPYRMAIAPNGSYLLATTCGRGIFRNELNVKECTNCDFVDFGFMEKWVEPMLQSISSLFPSFDPLLENEQEFTNLVQRQYYEKEDK